MRRRLFLLAAVSVALAGAIGLLIMSMDAIAIFSPSGSPARRLWPIALGLTILGFVLAIWGLTTPKSGER